MEVTRYHSYTCALTPEHKTVMWVGEKRGWGLNGTNTISFVYIRMRCPRERKDSNMSERENRLDVLYIRYHTCMHVTYWEVRYHAC